jgi:ParB-like nuclease domain
MTKRTCKQSRDKCADKLEPISDSCISLLASAGEMAIKLRPIASLTPHRRNARTHSRKQIQQLARSIKEFGFTNPVLIDAASGILAGHGRVEAAKLLGMAESQQSNSRPSTMSNGEPTPLPIIDWENSRGGIPIY